MLQDGSCLICCMLFSNDLGGIDAYWFPSGTAPTADSATIVGRSRISLFFPVFVPRVAALARRISLSSQGY
jgi:hypothetical protein